MRTVVCDLLGIEHPISNAPMAGAAGAELAAAVAEGGGCGLIGGSLRSPGALRDEIQRARDLTDRVVGVGFISHLAGTDGLCDIALEEGVRVIAHSFADPSPFIGAAHEAGAVVISQVRSVGEAVQAAAAGVDIVVAQGTEAGGHTGLRATLPLVPAVVDAVNPTPVIAAGGIADARGVTACLVLGAEGVWMGTRFLATPEAATRPWIHSRLLDASAEDTVLTDVFDIATGVGFPPGVHARALRNRFTDRWHGREADLGRWGSEERSNYLETEFSTEDGGPILAGESVGLVHDLRPATDLVRDIASEVRQLLHDRPHDLLD